MAIVLCTIVLYVWLCLLKNIQTQMKQLIGSLSDSYEINLCTSVLFNENKKLSVTINREDIYDFLKHI